MITVPYDKIIEIVSEKTDKDKSEIQKKIEERIDKLAGLVSKQGAAMIIAHEMGVDVEDEFRKEIKVKDLNEEMNNISLTLKITDVSEVNSFEKQTDNGTFKGKVASIKAGDETGTTRMVFWNDMVSTFKKLDFKEGDVYEFQNLRISKNNFGNLELIANNQTKIKKKKEEIEVKQNNYNNNYNEKLIYDLKQIKDDKRHYVTLAGHIVHLFDPRSFKVCPECKKRVKEESNVSKCNDHGEVDPDDSFFISGFLDDGTERVRITFFNNTIKNLLKTEEKRLKEEGIKNQGIGRYIEVDGRAIYNKQFERVEVVANQVKKVNVEKEIEKYKKRIEDLKNE